MEETQMTLGGMMSSRYVVPFKDDVGDWVSKMSTVSEILEQWVIVQNYWTYMEAVFSSGDIAKQLPAEAKRFAGIDKNYMKVMTKAFETPNVVQCCCGNDLLKNLLPHLDEQLELVQKSLTGYLELKRNMFAYAMIPVERALELIYEMERNPPADGDTWRMNVYRIERDNPTDRTEIFLAAFSPPYSGNFHATWMFGEIVFEK